MEDWMQNLSAVSNSLEDEVIAQYQLCNSPQEVERWLQGEITKLQHTDLAQAASFEQESWLKELFPMLRLQHLAKHGASAMIANWDAASNVRQAAQIEVLDILAEPGEGARLCAFGAGTYEMMLLRLQAMAAMECTLASTTTTYIERFCQEYGRFNAPLTTVQPEENWLPLLLSLHQALNAHALPEKAAVKEAVPAPHKSRRRKRSAPEQIQSTPDFSSWRERFIVFGSVFGVLFFCYAVLLGSPTLIIMQIVKNKGATARNKPSAPRLPYRTAPDIKLIASPTPPPLPDAQVKPSALPTPEVKATPTPTPDAAASERAGFYVIGLASREEASAQIELQKQRAAGLNPRVVFSSNWSGLTPNYYQVVYGIFASRGETAALRKDLEQRGIKTYVMHSGQRVRP
jgi:SPOR domain